MSTQVSCSFGLFVGLSAIELYEFFIYVGYLPYKMWFANIFPICSLYFHFVYYFFCCAEDV